MRRLYFSKSIEDLVEENKRELMSDPNELKKIELRLERRQLNYSYKKS